MNSAWNTALCPSRDPTATLGMSSHPQLFSNMTSLPVVSLPPSSTVPLQFWGLQTSPVYQPLKIAPLPPQGRAPSPTLHPVPPNLSRGLAKCIKLPLHAYKDGGWRKVRHRRSSFTSHPCSLSQSVFSSASSPSSQNHISHLFLFPRCPLCSLGP